MTRLNVAIACASVLLRGAAALAAGWDTVMLSYDFRTAPAGRPDPSVWIVNHPGFWWWVQGRTHFPNPDPC